MNRPSDVPFNAPAVERGMGFFETVLLVGRRAVLWEPHLARLYGTLRRFGFPEPDLSVSRDFRANCRGRGGRSRPGRNAASAWPGSRRGPDLEQPASWRLDVTVRRFPESTLARRTGSRAVTLRADLRRDTPDVKSTSYFAAVAGLRIARRAGGTRGSSRHPTAATWKGRRPSLIAWKRRHAGPGPSGALPSVHPPRLSSRGVRTTSP